MQFPCVKNRKLKTTEAFYKKIPMKKFNSQKASSE
ncbi:hypothetical protein NEOC65_001912 [Neochlamydia sp. AcF65]|nr:hypothetical protein [Neochlamydia sp. AcF65]